MLKYQWSPQQEKFIIAMKKQLEKRSFRIQPEVFFASLVLLRKRGLTLYEAWDEIDEELSDRYGKQFWFLIFCNTISCVFGQKTEISFSDQLKDFNFVESLNSYYQGESYNIMLLEQLKERGYTENEIKYLDDRLFHAKPPHILPVRLQDKALKKAVTDADLSKIIMLYDMQSNPGEKLKYIYHALLNDFQYDIFLFLLERYGKAECLTAKFLELHFLWFGTSEEKMRFNHFYCSYFGKNDPDLWCKAVAFGVLDSVISVALECGADPEWYVFCQKEYKISLRDFMHFIEEAAGELEKRFSTWNEQFRECRYWLSILRAAKIFSQWERSHLAIYIY